MNARLSPTPRPFALCCFNNNRKATGSLKIVHEVYAKNSGLADRLREELQVAMAHNEQLAQCVGELDGWLVGLGEWVGGWAVGWLACWLDG